ncbi:MAG: DNA-protecting protein DprA [Desulfatibacillum sp.]|nr:DNA-protecting protein DprA [Desulfatibacillum sp.]
MDQYYPWFFLKSVPGIGNLLFRRLLERFSHPEEVLAASQGSLMAVQGVTPRLACAIMSHKMPGHVLDDMKAARQSGFKIVTFADDIYPPLLRHIPDPPPLLYVYGQLPQGERNVAVVGSRSATFYGLDTTFNICRDLAEQGVAIVSGMARGIDTRAHQGALEGGGQTVAVLGCGLGKVYPRGSEELYHRIAQNGAVVSEFPVGSEPEARHFPVRNRIISGMCLATVVVEAAQKSGSLITANLAGEQGREVLAVPGSVESHKSTGAHRLIKQGAGLVENAQDILEALALSWRQPPKQSATAGEEPLEETPFSSEGLAEDEKSVLEALGPYPIHIDVLVQRLGMPVGELSANLLQLELKGLARQEPGKLFSRGRSIQ